MGESSWYKPSRVLLQTKAQSASQEGWSTLESMSQTKFLGAKQTQHHMASYPRVLQSEEKVCHVTCPRPNPDCNTKLTVIQRTDPMVKAKTLISEFRVSETARSWARIRDKKTTLSLMATLARRQFLSNLIQFSLFNKVKKRTGKRRKWKACHNVRICLNCLI